MQLNFHQYGKTYNDETSELTETVVNILKGECTNIQILREDEVQNPWDFVCSCNPSL